MANIVENYVSNNYQKSKTKKQIILTHTSRNITDYLNSVLYRNNGDYDKVPNFVISRNGDVYKLLPDNAYTNFFKKTDMNKNSVIISLENLGWLEKIPIETGFVNWIGDIYNGPVFEKKWRDYFFWHPYTSSQLEITVELCNMICEEVSIKKDFIGHNTKINGIERFEGIISRSNLESECTDLSPSFEFENFTKKIKNE